MSSGFEFLASTSGFSIAWFIIPFDPTKSYGNVYLVGILNILLVSLTSTPARENGVDLTQSGRGG